MVFANMVYVWRSCGYHALHSYLESLSDCHQSDLCFTTAVVAGSVSSASLLSIISCLIGALLHHILISSPCWKSNRPRKKKTTEESPKVQTAAHLYTLLQLHHVVISKSKYINFLANCS